MADKVIVSTSIKTGEKMPIEKERNIKNYKERVDIEKVKRFLKAAREK